jgi:RNA polymerase sigma-70 factor (ECF subfamily)
MMSEGAAIRWGTTAGRRQEFEAVALVHLDALYRSALRLTQNRAEAEDVVQDTCLRAFRSFHRFNPGTNCRAWLFTILRNAFLNRVRGAHREVHAGDAGEPWDALGERAAEPRPGAGTPEEAYLHTVLHGDVDRALKALPLAFREAIVLADLEGLSYKEIAQILACPVGTVMSRLARGRRLLRRALTDFAREHGYVGDPE